MKTKLFSIAMALLVSVSMVSTDAFAKRMGSASNAGMQRNVSPSTPANNPTINKAPSTTSTAAGATTGAASAATKSSWMGPLMGLAAGGLLAAAFMGGAFEGISAMDIILLLLLVGGIIYFLRRRTTTTQIPTTATANEAPYYRQTENIQQPSSIGNVTIGSQVASIETATTEQPVIAPEWFNATTFSEQAKHWYVTLQSAWDKKDWQTLSALTTTSLFDELKALRSSEPDNNVTEVEEVTALVREMHKEATGWVLTVEFKGYIREEQGAFSHAFNEFWHLVRIGDAEGEWKLAGIQQV